MRGQGSLALLVVFGVGAVSTLAAAGCGGNSPMARPPNQGVLWISWTVRGQPVSNTSCNGIDHLGLTMSTATGELSIEPIPCLRGVGWEYDGLPEGNNLVILDGFNTAGAVTLEGTAFVDVGPDKPATPAPIDLLRTN